MGGGATTGASGSRINALKPLPKAFLAIGNYLLCKLEVAFGTFTMYVVKHHWLSVAWRLRQAHVTWDHGREHLGSKEAAQVRGDLARERCPFVVHREKYAFNLERGIDASAQAHQRVEELGDALEGEVLALNRYKHRIACRQGVQGQQIEGGWAIHYDVIIASSQGIDDGPELKFALVHVHELNRRPHKVLVGGNYVEAFHLSMEKDAIDWLVQNQRMIKRLSCRRFWKTEA